MSVRDDQKLAAQEAIESLSKAKIDTASTGLDLYVQSSRKRDGRDGWYEVHLSKEAETSLIYDCRTFVLDCVGRPLVAYLEDCAEPDDVSFIHVNDFGDFASILDQVRSATKSVPFSKDVDPSNLKVRSSHLSFKDGSTEITLFGHAAVSQIGKRKQSFEIGPENEVRPFKGQLIQLGSAYTFLRYGDFFLIRDEPKFENLTGYRELIEKRAETAVDTLSKIEGIVFDNQDELIAASVNTEFARKLAAAQSAGILERLSRDSILKDIQDNKITISHEIRGDTLHLKPNLDHRQDRRDFIDLLVENFWTSSSGQKYRAVKKMRRP